MTEPDAQRAEAIDTALALLRTMVTDVLLEAMFDRGLLRAMWYLNDEDTARAREMVSAALLVAFRAGASGDPGQATVLLREAIPELTSALYDAANEDPEPVPTSGGVPLTEEKITELATEAERGYDTDRLRPRTAPTDPR